jgi:hypothetical protein
MTPETKPTINMTGLTNAEKLELMREVIAPYWPKEQEINDTTAPAPIIDRTVPTQEAQKKSGV